MGRLNTTFYVYLNSVLLKEMNLVCGAVQTRR